MKAGISQKLLNLNKKSKHEPWEENQRRNREQYLFAVHVWLKMAVSLNELHNISECTLGDLCVYSANF